MNTESIIGITASTITIIGAILWLKDKIKKRPIAELFVEIMDKKISDKKRRVILTKMNKHPLMNNKIRKEYIQEFTLGKRGKEEVLFDICDSNEIAPTDDICQGLLGYSRYDLLTKYQDKRNSMNSMKEKSTSAFVETMESDHQKEVKTTTSEEKIVYMSEKLKTDYSKTCDMLTQILDKYHVKYSYIKGTNDIWCRDYMPVQIESGKLIQFKYDPSYLKGEEWDRIRSNVNEIRKKNDWLEKYTIEESDINLDGGNVLICEGRAIISDRIFAENPNEEKEALINKLSKLLDCEIIIIPALKSKEEDMTGHADGMVRFVNRNTVIGNERLPNEYKYMKEGLQNAIDKYNLTYIDIPYFEDKDREHPISALGIYVNYLEVNDLIVFPVFGREEDAQAIEIIKKVFPNKQIETINYNDVAKEGGLLNCTTWVVNSPK